MQASALYKSHNLGHLGLVAALYDELGIGHLIDTLIPQDFERRDVSVGQAVKAMVLNGLGFAEHALYLTPHFFNDKPIDRLIAPGIKAEQLNDTTLGRAMDSLYEHGISEIFSQISTKTVRLLNLDCRIGQLKENVGLEYLNADSALYTAKSLQEMSDCLWVTRVPETINLTKDIIAAVVPDLIETPNKSSFRSLCTTYAGISQRWIVIYSPESRRRATKTINKNWLKQTTALQKSFQQLCHQNYGCQGDAEQALQTFQQKQKLIEIIPEAVEKIARYNKSGRPGKDQPADYFDYQIRGSLMTLIEPRIQRIQRKSCYVLATNWADENR